jgi:uncharacterized protein YegP (UPF0339 family)
MANRPIVIEITPGDEPHIRFKGGNGEIMVASETYQGGADKAEQTVTKIVEEIQAGNFIIQVNRTHGGTSRVEPSSACTASPRVSTSTSPR